MVASISTLATSDSSKRRRGSLKSSCKSSVISSSLWLSHTAHRRSTITAQRSRRTTIALTAKVRSPSVSCNTVVAIRLSTSNIVPSQRMRSMQLCLKPAKKPVVLVVKSAVKGEAHCSCGTCLKVWSKTRKTSSRSGWARSLSNLKRASFSRIIPTFCPTSLSTSRKRPPQKVLVTSWMLTVVWGSSHSPRQNLLNKWPGLKLASPQFAGRRPIVRSAVSRMPALS